MVAAVVAPEDKGSGSASAVGPRCCGLWCGLKGFDEDGGAVGEDFGDALHDLVGVVTEADDGVGSLLSGVLGHEDEGVVAGLFAELGVEGDVAADEGLEAGADGSEDGTRAHDDAADDADVAGDAVAGEFEGGGDHGLVEGDGRGGVGGHGGSLKVVRMMLLQ